MLLGYAAVLCRSAMLPDHSARLRYMVMLQYHLQGSAAMLHAMMLHAAMLHAAMLGAAMLRAAMLCAAMLGVLGRPSCLNSLSPLLSVKYLFT